MPSIIPDKYTDLVETAIVVTLASIMPDGAVHQVAVWRRWDGSHILITSDATAQKVKNLRANPHVSVFALDPKNSGRYLSIRGMVEEITPQGVIAELDRHTKLYTGADEYFGSAEPIENKATFHGVIIRIRPEKVIGMG